MFLLEEESGIEPQPGSKPDPRAFQAATLTIVHSLPKTSYQLRTLILQHLMVVVNLISKKVWRKIEVSNPMPEGTLRLAGEPSHHPRLLSKTTGHFAFSIR